MPIARWGMLGPILFFASPVAAAAALPHPPGGRPAAECALSVAAFGAAGDNHTHDTGAIRRAIAACPARCAGVTCFVTFPRGEFLTGPLDLRDNGSVFRAMIEARNVSNVGIQGRGAEASALVGQGARWFAREQGLSSDLGDIVRMVGARGAV
eukprot:gene5962-8320_t